MILVPGSAAGRTLRCRACPSTMIHSRARVRPIPPKDRPPMSLDSILHPVAARRRLADRAVPARLSAAFVLLAGRLRRRGLRRRAAAARPGRSAAALGHRHRRAAGHAATSCEALAEHDLELWRSDLTRAQRQRRQPVAPPGRRRRRGRGLHARRPGRPTSARRPRRQDGAGPRSDANGALIELVARYAAPDSARREPQFTRLTLSRQDGRWASRTEVAPLVAQVRLASGTIRIVAVRRHRRGAHSGRGGRADGRDLRRRHRLPPRTAQGRHLQRGLRGAHRRRRAGHLGRADRPRAVGRVRQRRQGPPRAVVHRRQRPRCATSASTARASAAPSWPARWSSRA